MNLNKFWTATFLLFCLAHLAGTLSPALMLTPYIARNETALARNLSSVNPSLFLNVTSHSGFLTVDAAKNSNLFFWYFPVPNKPLNTTPWIIWLQGGPGATSLAGLFEELGPFYYDKQLKLREWSWTKEYSMLFIDSPVGAGFSFTDSETGFVRNMDECSNHLYGALQQFLELFPEHRSAPLYLAGESYAGHFVPTLAEKILHPPPEVTKMLITNTTVNLKGLMMGNPIIDRTDEVDLTSAYYQWGLIDSQGVIAARPLQAKYEKAVWEKKESKAFDLRNELIDKLSRLSYQVQTYNALKGDIRLQTFEQFVTRGSTREAIHVGDLRFTFSNATVHNKLLPDFLAIISPKIEELLEHYRIMIYCGQFDLTVPCVPGARARLKKWRWSRRDQFLAAPRRPWAYNDDIAGYVKSGGGFTEVLVRNAGHLVPMDKPAEAQALISHFIDGHDLPLPVSFREKDIETPPFDDTLLPDQATSGKQNTSDNKPSDPKEPKDAKASEFKQPIDANKGIVASAVLNVIFVVIIILGVVYWVRWKRRTESYFYNMIDTENASLSDGILTMN